MTRTIFSKVTWLARVTSTVVGLAIMLALVFGVASVALGANGNPWILGQGNVATARTPTPISACLRSARQGRWWWGAAP